MFIIAFIIIHTYTFVLVECGCISLKMLRLKSIILLLFYLINKSWLRNVIKTNVKFGHGKPFNRIVPIVLKLNVKYLKI